MTAASTPALRVTLTAPVVSFRNHLYPGVQVTLPCPSPSTVAGLLAGTAGGWDQVDHDLRFAMAFHAAGTGTDLETYHPLDATGKATTPAPRTREFLTGAVLTIWLQDDIDLWRHRLRRPVWPLRLGRSQDLVGIHLETTTLHRRDGEQRGAVVARFPKAGGTLLRLPTAVAPGRERTNWGDYHHDATGRSRIPVPDSWSEADGQAVSLLPPVHPAVLFTRGAGVAPVRRAAVGHQAGGVPDRLASVLAKSARGGAAPEALTAHLNETLKAAVEVARRVGRIEVAERETGGRFWQAVLLGGLTHDTGKLPDGFQRMVRGLTRSWGERHEVASLGFLDALVPDEDVRAWVAAAVATHHRALSGTDGRDLRFLYEGLTADELATRIGPIDGHTVRALLDWLHATAADEGLPTVRHRHGDLFDAEELIASAHRTLTALLQRWERRVDPDTGLTAVLLQGAVTLADHLSSAHGSLHTTQPFDHSFRAALEQKMTAQGRTLREHQLRAAVTSGHLFLRAPTGSGKTEAVLLWASRQVVDIASHGGGVPRVFFTLPYLASINAMADRFADLLGDPELIGVAHSRAASYHLAAAIDAADGGDEEDQETGPCRADEAAKALSRATATKLFRESVRVGTPYQLMRAALAGPAHAGMLADAANSVFILDELHAYDPRRLGYILASARLWERLGGRIAVVSATLPDVLTKLFTETLVTEPSLVDTPDLGLPPRHHLQIRHHHLLDEQAADEIRERLHRNQSVLVVANNVAHARGLFEELAPYARALHGDDSAFLLHSRFTRHDRDRIERGILGRFASSVADRRPGLLVATQVVEVSLDLDLDVLFTAAAPLEALLQRFGRINRLGSRQPADVIVHSPAWTRRRGQAGDFADGIYPREPVETGWERLTAHADGPVGETDATTWLNTIYTATPWGRQWHDEVITHRDAFDTAFLQFRRPFADRTGLAQTFDDMFDGTEAILEQDRDAYTGALAQGTDAEGRLLADQYLIPMPAWATPLSRFEKALNVRVLDAEYEPDLGLLAVRGPHQQAYQPGEVL
ncbi:CRISPR-associated helicase Cas3' [Streptomyces sp. SP17BM10]|uniref:CRISPR-associated helicase Cas3' n=1 Tax=Streptomyces sp. SP17BM10 TaxID=3002530 RepID=UPI002E786F40|nr:CRISPR-associated helicase Cas3' [Streptomyces sp. SP17BM10]MEE1783260.1 CRISPR-associated helicase Cas3' [Streptomyces sp. SP17BM10]